jgi:hypothetical protein
MYIHLYKHKVSKEICLKLQQLVKNKNYLKYETP